MGYAEVVFETGAKSVMQYDDIEELKAGLKEHHRRAIEGENAGPQNRPAERIKRVFLYSDHPAGNDAFNDLVSADTVSKLVEGMNKGGSISSSQLMQALRDETSPVYPQDQGRHESIYKASGSEMTDLSWLESDGE